ncbi:phosphoglycerate kinase [bacterium]|nr:phosphoglycerate kinase [bacterium]
MNKLSIKDLDLKGKRALIRVDFNVPFDKNQNITDDTRIQAALPTIRYAIDKGARVVLMSHLGRPKGKVVPEMSLKPVAVHLGKLLGREVGFAPDSIGDTVEEMADNLKEGGVLLLENLRFHPEEKSNDAGFAEKLSHLGDVYINDAFGTAHRAHASTEGVTKYFDKCAAGFLMEKELTYLGKAVENPENPFVLILGGAKVSDKIPVIENFAGRVSKILIGGGMMFTFLKAQGKNIGKSILDEEHLNFAAEALSRYPEKIVLPVDCVVSDVFNFAERRLGTVEVVSCDSISDSSYGLDIGPESLEKFGKILSGAKTIVWNGPMGVFEIKETAEGTLGVARLVAEATEQGATSIVGGGDSASAVKSAGVSEKMTHVSTGGGASLEFLQGKVLPGVAALTERGDA